MDGWKVKGWMVMKVKPMGMLLMMLAGWINRHQQDVITYLKEEDKILREKLGTKRILLNDNQRMRLARLGKQLRRSVLADACYVFSPDTILRWHARLVARKYDGSKKKSTPGRKRISEEVSSMTYGGTVQKWIHHVNIKATRCQGFSTGC
jgi:hypothetical protein